ncbi:P2Y purinoceptor 3 [Erpetoichthys calabaricus]|uniref:P2Y purinoceptor 3 n=1 Tax=Erpetoichthys calabaricus TaxID=27687 RepID=UPI00109EE3E0|nr:P2Y purinoceptor 3 [Erpetoichthys calabaricus]XP_028656184.1 P2Y purinoceptor 3 [Erpetoichthys calabaricus]XP_051782791.1 P2Y purinoceptor 3 [Erpetoichthys calabaricus]
MANFTTPSTSDMSCTYNEDFKQILLPTVYSVVLVLGLPLNGVVIFQIWQSRKALTRTTIYMLNLAIADFLYVCSLPLLIYNYAQHDYWPFGDFMCKFVRFQFYSNLHGSIMFLTCISFQRYLGICHPLAMWHKKGGRKFAWMICILVWIIVFVLCAPTFEFATTGIQRNRTVCYDLTEPQRSKQYVPYGMALTFIGFLIPFLAIIVCYCCMTRILCQKNEMIGPAVREKKDKAIRMVIIVVVVFAISFFPFHLTKTMYLVFWAMGETTCWVKQTFSIIYKCTRPFASMNSVLDPILFYFTQQKFRQSTKSILEKMSSKR